MKKNVIYFKRKVYDAMLRWKKERNGATALLIQGARRIGKSTIAEQFAQREYESYILIDFSIAPKEITDLFQDISDLNYIFVKLQLFYQVNLKDRKSVIIFDEVQKQPLARQAIKHLVKDGRYDYIETGSLISVRKSSVDIVIPSEETKIDMFPMDYEEFRWAMGDEVTIPLLRTMFEKKQSLGDAIHRKMMRDFRLYMLVGGMPQAVAKYIQTNDLADVDLVKRDIIALYEEDFEKIDASGRAKALFDAIPAQLSKNVSRYTISSVLPNEKADRVENIIKSMEDTMTTNVAYHSNDPNVGLALTKDLERYKMYVADTGLFITLAFKNKDFTSNLLYNKLLNDKLNANLGYIYENMIAQMLRTLGKELYYHIIPTQDGKKYYETDFLISDDYNISPIEVKSSGYKTHTSLDVFCDKYSDRIKNRYLIYTKDLAWEKGILYIPIYMTMFL
ncbi:MAG: AAA family ATPase [Paludibacteraceae bacterium]|nr:AAA family ATPase [Paludibacteraceae bacterium]